MRKLIAASVLTASAVALVTGVASAQDEVTSTDPTVEAPVAVDDTATTAAPETTTTTQAPTATAPTTAPTTAPSSVQPPTSEPAGEAAGVTAQQACDPNYSGACVPTNVGDVNCDDVPGTDFQVIGEDIYGLDQGGTPNVACESNESTAVAPTQQTTPTTAPATSAAPTTNTLPETGSTSTVLAVIGFVVLALGASFVSFGGYIANPLTGRLRGGYTVTTIDRRGQQVRYRVTTRK